MAHDHAGHSHAHGHSHVPPNLSGRAMGAAGRVLAQDRYSWDAIARRLLKTYEGAIDDVRAPGAAAS